MKPVRFFSSVAALFLAWCSAEVAAMEPAVPTGPAASPRPTTPTEEVDGYLKIGFDRLGAFQFITHDPADNPRAPVDTGESQIPEGIKKLNGKKVIVTGFMLPVKNENGLTTEFLLMQNQLLCCYGIAPSVNQWVVVTMAKGGVKPTMDVPVSFRGTLHVGALFENGYLTAIYSLDGEKQADSAGR